MPETPSGTYEFSDMSERQLADRLEKISFKAPTEEDLEALAEAEKRAKLIERISTAKTWIVGP